MVDIGFDYVYFFCYVVLNYKVSGVIVGEIIDGLFLFVKWQVEKLGLSVYIFVRQGDGLEVIKKGEVDVIMIVGMGGFLIVYILEVGKDKLMGKEWFILQLNIYVVYIREWFFKEGYVLINEVIFEEDGKCYEVFVVEVGDRDVVYVGIFLLVGMFVGFFLVKEKSVVFLKKWI